VIIETFVIAGNRCESKSFHDGQVDGITGQGAMVSHLLTHLGDVCGHDRFQCNQIAHVCGERIELHHKLSDDFWKVMQILAAVPGDTVGFPSHCFLERDKDDFIQGQCNRKELDRAVGINRPLKEGCACGEATVLSMLAIPSRSIEFRLPQGFPGGVQLQGATQAGEGFLTRRQVTGFLVSIEAVHSDYHGFLAIDKVPMAYQLIQLRHDMLRQPKGSVVQIRCDRH
jgi:hypothetical protein